MDVYAHAVTGSKRHAQHKIVQMMHEASGEANVGQEPVTVYPVHHAKGSKAC